MRKVSSEPPFYIATQCHPCFSLDVNSTTLSRTKNPLNEYFATKCYYDNPGCSHSTTYYNFHSIWRGCAHINHVISMQENKKRFVNFVAGIPSSPHVFVLIC